MGFFSDLSDAISGKGPNEGNIDFRDGRNWGQTRQGELPSYETDFDGRGNTGSMLASAWKKGNQPKRLGDSFFGLSGATRTDADGNVVTGRASNPGSAVGALLGALVPAPGASLLGSKLGGKMAEDRFNFSPLGDPGPRGTTAEDSNLDDDRTAARQPTSTPSTTVTPPVLPLTAAQRRKRAAARSPVSTTETLLGA